MQLKKCCRDADMICIPSDSTWKRIAKVRYLISRKKLQRIEPTAAERRILGSIFDKDYDTVLLLNANGVSLAFVKCLRVRFAQARFILYIWDDLENVCYPEGFLHLFDKVYSYSFLDALESEHIRYLPFFYSDRMIAHKTWDLSFVGSLHSDRYQLLRKILRSYPDLSVYQHIYVDLFSYLKNFFKLRINPFYLSFRKLTYSQYIYVLAQSKAVIEIPNTFQRNVTTRAIEVLGTRTKLLTTSAAVRRYDFYNPDNVLVYRDTATSDCIPGLSDWLKKPYNDYAEELLHKYSLENWINEIMSDA